MAISKFTVDGVTQIDLTQDTIVPEHLYVNETAVNAAGDSIEGAAQADNEDAFLERSLSGIYYNPDITTIGATAFRWMPNITKINVPNVTKIGDESVYNLTGLEEINTGQLTSLGTKAFMGCSSLKIPPNISGLVTLPSYAFNGCAALESIDLTNKEAVSSYTFQDCSSLKQVSLPNLIYQADATNTFQNCTALESVYMPKCQGFGGNQVFMGCSSLKGIVLPNLGGHNGAATTFNIYQSWFNNDKNLEYVDVRTPPSIATQAFIDCSKLTTLIIRGERVTSLANIAAFTRTPFASGQTGGTLYVPQDMIESYESATNWSTILNYENNQILPIEGSQYEHYYADGTSIPTDGWDLAANGVLNLTNATRTNGVIIMNPTGLNWNFKARLNYLFYTWGEVKTNYKVRVSFDYVITNCVTGGSLAVAPELVASRAPGGASRLNYDTLNSIAGNGSGHYEQIQDPITIRYGDGAFSDTAFYGLCLYAYTGNGSHVEISNLVFEVAPSEAVEE